MFWKREYSLGGKWKDHNKLVGIVRYVNNYCCYSDGNMESKKWVLGLMVFWRIRNGSRREYCAVFFTQRGWTKTKNKPSWIQRKRWAQSWHLLMSDRSHPIAKRKRTKQSRTIKKKTLRSTSNPLYTKWMIIKEKKEKRKKGVFKGYCETHVLKRFIM